MKYDPALDGMRAIAVTAVVAYHVDSGLLPGGWAGVDVFFVLSGFLITSILRREQANSGTIGLKRFYLRRVLRLSPALLALLIATTLIAIGFGQFRRAAGAALYSATYTMNWIRAFGWTPQWALGHTWSLAMEEQFYLVWPALLLAVRPRLRLPVTAVLIAIIILWRCYLALHGADPERTYNGFDTHTDGLLLGCVLSFVGEPKRLPGLALWSVLVVAGLALVFLFLPLHAVMTQSIGLTLTALLSVLAIICARQEGWLRRVLMLPPLVFTGRISYGFYLWHYPLLVLFRPLLPKHTSLLLVAAAYLLAVLSFYTVEAYFQRLKHRLDDIAYRRRNAGVPSAGGAPAQALAEFPDQRVVQQD